MDFLSQIQGKHKVLPPKPRISMNEALELNLLTLNHRVHHLLYSLAS